MSSVSTRVHRVHEVPRVHGAQRTACGVVGYYHRAREYDTMSGTRFEATTDEKAVTCKNCIRYELSRSR